MYSVTRQVDVAKNAARIFIQENHTDLPYETTILSDEKFVDTLEPYGLPLGFVPRTVFGQDIVLVIEKTDVDVGAYLVLRGGDLSGIQMAELARRIGFYAFYDMEHAPHDIEIGIQLSDMYSDTVRRNERDSKSNEFLTDLDMGDFSVNNVGSIFARNVSADTAQIGNVLVYGTESGRKVRNKIENIVADKTVFQTTSGEVALSITRGALKANTVSTRTVSKFGLTGNMTFVDAAMGDFDMTAGYNSFTGPEKWDVHGNVVTDNINFSVERLDVESFLNLARGQDVYIDYDSLDYSTASGITADNIYVSNITLRDQTSQALNRGQGGAAILDVRPAGTSVLSDVLLDGIDNSQILIIKNPTKDDGDTVECKDIISGLGETYNSKSLAQYLVCQYVFWQRLEKRINIKQCLQDGGDGCL